MENKKDILDKLIEKKIINTMQYLDLEETEELLSMYDLENMDINEDLVEDIKKRVEVKIELDSQSSSITKDNTLITKEIASEKYGFKKYISIAAILILALLVTPNNILVEGFNRILQIIPGVGLVEVENQEVLYRLKDVNSSENNTALLDILSAAGKKDSITIGFSLERKNITEEEVLIEKEKEFEKLKNGGKLEKVKAYLEVDGQRYEADGASRAGDGIKDFHIMTFNLNENNIGTDRVYKLIYEEYDVSAQFELVDIEQYSSLDEIGSNDIKNNISLTATSSLENNNLAVTIYPLNYSKYRLISFESEFDLEYFGKKIVLKEENKERAYTLPSSFGSGFRPSFFFDIENEEADFIFHIPYVLVESSEEKNLKLPIPRQGGVVELNQEVNFEDGTVMIESVEHIKYDDTQDRYIKVNLSYKNQKDNMEMVGVKLTRNRSEGWFEEYDEQGRLSAINYLLDKPDIGQLKINMTNPRYLFMDEYNLQVNVN